ncbi:MAG: hypothetical protein WCD30_15355 [Pseudolabrys sp.]
MIETIMYFGIGFLLAALVAVALIPLVHGRAVRLTIRRMEHSIPQSMAEIQADKDALRAEFAMSTRRLEIIVDELKNKHTTALAELGRKGNAINRLKIEREAQKVGFVALKAEVVTLKDQLTVADKEIEAIKVQRHADDLVTLAPKGWPAGEELLNHAADARDPGQRVELAGDRSDVGAGLQEAESSIRMSPSTGIIPNNFVHLFMVGLVGFGAAFAWQQYHAEGAKELIRRVSSLGSLLFESTTKSPLDVDVAAKQTGLTPVPQVSAQDAGLPQPEPITPASPAPAAAAIFPEQSELAAKQQQLPNELQADELETKQETLFPPLQNGTTLPESPTSLEGWSLREVTAGIAVLEGPTGIWRVTPGDTLPGVGKVESYIRSNGQWIVATSSGLISMPVRHNEPSPSLQNDPKLTPTGETTPKTIEAWTLHEVTNGTAVLQGPIGTLRVTLGDTVAGLGKVTAIVRWGKGWVVATSAGYCASAPPDHADGICKPYRRD